ncbi:MAG: toxin-antitoxin system YwqK family antitoxin [Pseudomonadota bacterium]
MTGHWISYGRWAIGVGLAALLSINLVAAERFNAASQPTTVDATRIVIERSTGDRTLDGRAYSGTAITHFPNGDLAKSEQFVDGRREGVLRMWFANGNLAFESRYRKGRRMGATVSWWANGAKRSETYYADDKPDGISWHWYSTGAPYKRYSYAAGQPVGLQKAWRKNGKLYSNFEYRNGRAYGLRNANLCVELNDEQIFDEI